MAINKKEQATRQELMGKAGSHTYNYSYLIEAGAGAGKTYTMTNRIIQQLTSGVNGSKPENLVAITFTEKATQEMLGRIDEVLKDKLEQAKQQQNKTEEAKLKELRDNIGKMHISTIHSFCQLLLSTMPYYSKIGPNFTVMDGKEAKSYASAFYKELLEEPSRAQKLQEVVEHTGLEYEEIKKEFLALCDDFAELANPGPDAATRLDQLFTSCQTLLQALITKAPVWKLKALLLKGDQSEFVARFKDAVNQKNNKAPSLYSDPIVIETFAKLNNLGGFKSTIAIGESKIFATSLEKLTSPLDSFAKLLLTKDKAAYLKLTSQERRSLINELVDTCKKAGLEAEATVLKDAWLALVYYLVMDLLKDFIRLYKKHKEQEKKLSQTDLLLYTRDMLRESKPAREYFHQRYRTIYVDEMQDTNPIQAQILFYITTEEKDFDANDWRKCEPVPGSLFLVGDPKQAIYRFTGADIAIYKDLQKHPKLKTETLEYNYRSSEEICAFVNGQFYDLMKGSNYQANYKPTEAVHGKAGKPSIIAYTSPSLEQDAKRVAEYIEQMVKGQVQLGMQGNEELHQEDTFHPAGYGDFMILTKDTYGVETYVQALAKHNIPYNMSGRTELKDFEVVRKILAVINLLLDCQDETKLTLVLHQGYGIDLTLIAAYKARTGNLSLFNNGVKKALEEEAQQGGADLQTFQPILKALDELAYLQTLTTQDSGMATLEALLDKTSVCWNNPQDPNPSRTYAITRQLLSMAKEKGYGSFLEMAEALRKAAEGEIEREILLADKQDYVRVMNLHKAKGLQSEVVFLAYAASKEVEASSYTEFKGNEITKYVNWSEKSFGKYVPKARVEGWTTKYAVEEAAFQAAETLRLLYVAATRPKSMLFICGCAGSEAEEEAPTSYWQPLLEGADAHTTSLEAFDAWLKTATAPTAVTKTAAATKASGTPTAQANTSSKLAPSAVSPQTLDLEALDKALEAKASVVNTPESFNISPSKLNHGQRSTITRDDDGVVPQGDTSASNTQDNHEEANAAKLQDNHGETNATSASVGTTAKTVDAPVFIPYGADWGTIIHRVMELVVRYKAFEDQAQQKRFILQAILETIDPKQLTAEQQTKLLNNQPVDPVSFLQQAALQYIACLMEPQGWFRQLLASAQKVYGEYPFYAFEADGNSNFAQKVYAACKEAPTDRLPLAVEGIIDLLVKIEDKYYVLDYKTDKIDTAKGETPEAYKARLLKEYTNQLTCYAELLEHCGKPVAGISLIALALGGERLELTRKV